MLEDIAALFGRLEVVNGRAAVDRDELAMQNFHRLRPCARNKVLAHHVVQPHRASLEVEHLEQGEPVEPLKQFLSLIVVNLYNPPPESSDGCNRNRGILGENSQL